MNYSVWLLGVCTLGLVACGGSGGGSDPVAGCPNIENPDPTNTDGDLLFDVCDPDDDGDGFNDENDPAPLDPAIPGDFSTPEAILSNDAMALALQEAEAAGYPVVTELGVNPPDLSGYYIREDAAGSFPVNSSSFDQGRGWVGAESRVEQTSNNFIKGAAVSFTSFEPISFSISEGTIVRGDGNSYTTYSRTKGTCTEENSDYEIFSVSITSATVNETTGDIESLRGVSTTVDVAGELTTACADRTTGLRELVGNWSVSEVSVVRKVIPSALSYMCVSDDDAYVPTETWINNDGLSCSCTLEYQLVCE